MKTILCLLTVLSVCSICTQASQEGMSSVTSQEDMKSLQNLGNTVLSNMPSNISSNIPSKFQSMTQDTREQEQGPIPILQIFIQLEIKPNLQQYQDNNLQTFTNEPSKE